MKTIKNDNGRVYEVLKEYTDNEKGQTVLLLADYGNKEVTAIQAGANPTQYIVANYWDEKSRTWGSGQYFPLWADGNAFSQAVSAFVCKIDLY